ncbi:hypothetical protein STRIP9103_05218, partial [Streptomyces ipomoeae 91-03]
VQRAARAHVREGRGVEDALLRRPPERRAVRVLGAEVRVPGVEMRVEVEQGHRASRPGGSTCGSVCDVEGGGAGHERRVPVRGSRQCRDVPGALGQFGRLPLRDLQRVGATGGLVRGALALGALRRAKLRLGRVELRTRGPGKDLEVPDARVVTHRHGVGERARAAFGRSHVAGRAILQGRFRGGRGQGKAAAGHSGEGDGADERGEQNALGHGRSP